MAKKVRTPAEVQRDIDANKRRAEKLKKELSDSKDANYYAAKVKSGLSSAKKSTKKYGKKAGKGLQGVGKSIAKFLTSK